jgi:hypothetical protein
MSTDMVPFPVPDQDKGAGTRGPWYQRRSVLLGIGVVLVIAIAVVTDLPTSQTHASNVASANAFIKEVNVDLQPCDYAVQESYTYYKELLNDTLLPEDRAHLGSQLSDDQVACSYVDPSVLDLTSLDSPTTTAAHPLGQMLAQVTQWVAEDAQQAIGYIDELTTSPSDAKGLAGLATETRHLGVDRTGARASIESAERMLRATLHQVNLPTATDPATS